MDRQPCQMSPKLRIPLIWVCLSVALVVMVVRLGSLEHRVFHGDEAVQAMRTAALMEERAHPFDPSDHHGPLLHYLSAGQHFLLGVRSSEGMSERSVRFLPYLFSIALLLMPLLLQRMTDGISALALPLIALSPCFFFFSGYFIQEPLLAALSLLAVILVTRMLHGGYTSVESILLAVVIGLLFTLKVSALLLGVTIGVTLLVSGCRPSLPPPGRGMVLVGAFLAPVLLVYSSFLMKPSGLLDFVRSLFDGMGRAVDGSHHAHGPMFFLERLIYYRASPGPYWSEWPIVLPALASLVVVLACWKKAATWQRFLAFQPFALLLVYLLVPYKTPWLLLSPLVLLGISATVLPTMVTMPIRLVAVPIFLLLPLSQIPTLKDTSGRFSSDPRNPWVYSHTVSTASETADKLDTMLQVSSRRGGIMAILGGDYWPYPWFLRGHDNIGYWPTLPDIQPDIVLLPLEQLDMVREALAGEYIEEYVPMRPEVPLVLLVERGLWDEWLREFRQ